MNQDGNETHLHIVDSMMGHGKTSAAYHYMMEHLDKKFIFVTNTNENVDVAYNILKQYRFVKLEKIRVNGKATKYNDLISNIGKRNSIILTHAMFDFFDDTIVDLLQKAHYTLIMDEIHDTISVYDKPIDDIQIMIQGGCCSVIENNVLQWNKPTYKGKSYYQEMLLCQRHRLIVPTSTMDSKDIKMLQPLKLFPVDVFKSFDDVFILTYLYGASILSKYFELYHFDYDKVYVTSNQYNEFKFTFNKDESNSQESERQNFKNLIHVYEPDEYDTGLNAVGFDKYALSMSWYDKQTKLLSNSRTAKKSQIIVLKNDIYNYVRNKMNAKSGDVLWTAPKQYKELLESKGFKKSFLSCTAKGDNQYREKTVLVYAINRFMQPNVSNYLRNLGIEVDEDKYALSEMIQWIWRSAIRDGKPIWIYIPSNRMRNLLLLWLDGKFDI